MSTKHPSLFSTSQAQCVSLTISRNLGLCTSKEGQRAVVESVHLSPKGYVVCCRFHGALMSVCLFVMSSVVHHEGGVWRPDFFSKRLGLIAWLRESMSRRNPFRRSASSPRVEEIICISFSSCSTPGKGLYSSSRHLKPMSLTKDLHQVLNPKKWQFRGHRHC